MSNIKKIHKSGNYENLSSIDADLIFSPILSLNEKALLIVILSMPEDIELSKSNLHDYLPDSNYTINKTFASLIDKGFIKSSKIKDSKGQFIGIQYEVFQTPNSKYRIL